MSNNTILICLNQFLRGSNSFCWCQRDLIHTNTIYCSTGNGCKHVLFTVNHSSFLELITWCRCFVRLNLGMIPQECRVKERCSWSHLLEVLIQGHSSKPEQFSSPQAGHGNEGHGFQVTCEKRLQGTRCQLRITTRRKNRSQTWKSDCPPCPTASPTACRMATLHGPQMKVWPTDPPTTQTAYDMVWSDYVIPYVLWSDITWYPQFTHVWLELWSLPLLEDPEKTNSNPKRMADWKMFPLEIVSSPD